LGELGVEVTPLAVSKASIPIAIFAFVYGAIQNYFLDRRIAKKLSQKNSGTTAAEVK